jgi:hypothetical protein
MQGRVALLVGVFLVVFGSGAARAQHFGKNKVEYVDFDFRLFETPHFIVYHYTAEEDAARIVARLAERWYARLSRVLDHQLEGRQPLILYGSQPEFAQTNVVNGFLTEGVGGVTESARRRIVMPFAPTLGETDRILGHELTHAFQFDLARRYRGGLRWPLWAIEGLAQYLSLGAADTETATWLRDAVAHDLLPAREQDAARRFSPYRYGHAFWAYLAGRFGDRIIPEILKASKAGSLRRRIKYATGAELDALYAEWRSAASEAYTGGSRTGTTPEAPALPSKARFQLGPVISPDARRAIFFSERDRVSVDLFLADLETRTVTKKLATTAASLRFESLQAVRSSGSWSPEGDRFVFAAIDRGEPTLILLDVEGSQKQEIRLPQFGQVLNPSWSPDGRAIAFSSLTGGLTDLYLYELTSGSLRQLTDDIYADLHPEWSPDGRRIAFVTDRFSTDLETLEFRAPELALMDLPSGEVTRIRGIEGGAHVNPQWSPDGSALYFVSAPGGVSGVFRVAIDSGDVWRVSDPAGGVMGLTPTSPAISVARGAPALAYSRYRNGRYELVLRRGNASMVGEPLTSAHTPAVLPPAGRVPGAVAEALGDQVNGLLEPDRLAARPYRPDMFLEVIGPPHISSGGGPFGTFVRGGGSFLFSDQLGERKLAVFAQAGNHLRDVALGVQFLNRERRWNWGAVASVEPSLRRLPRVSTTTGNEAAMARETHYFERTQLRVAGLLAYPLDRAQRVEFEGGAVHTRHRRSVSTVVRSLEDGSVISRSQGDGIGGDPATAGELSAAYVRDTAVFGPTGPILGGRSRFEVTSTFGALSATRVLLDHRRYLMPVKPYTIAYRAVHLGQYGPDAADPRLLPTFLGSGYFLRGYGWGSIRCRLNAEGACSGYDELLGSRLFVGNIEVRAPLGGVASGDLTYGPVPIEGFLFADAGLVWSRAPEFSSARAGRRLVRSFGAGVRVNAFGFPIEWAAVRATDPPSRGWSFGVSFRPAF